MVKLEFNRIQPLIIVVFDFNYRDVVSSCSTCFADRNIMGASAHCLSQVTSRGYG